MTGRADESEVQRLVSAAYEEVRLQREAALELFASRPPSSPSSFIYPELDFEGALGSIKSHKAGTILVSFHTAAYFNIFSLTQHFPFHVIALADPRLVNEVNTRFPELLQRIMFVDQFKPEHLKAARSGNAVLFATADVMSAASPTTTSLLFGRYVALLAHWAKLAVRFDLQVMPIIITDGGQETCTHNIHVHAIREHSEDWDILVYKVCEIFEAALQSDLKQWFFAPLWAAFGRPSVAMACPTPEAVMSEVVSLAKSHEGLLRRIKSIAR